MPSSAQLPLREAGGRIGQLRGEVCREPERRTVELEFQLRWQPIPIPKPAAVQLATTLKAARHVAERAGRTCTCGPRGALPQALVLIEGEKIVTLEERLGLPAPRTQVVNASALTVTQGQAMLIPTATITRTPHAAP